MTGVASLPTIAILATAETSASAVYGMYDLFRCVGRDWAIVVDGRPGEPLLDPLIVSRRDGAILAGNGVPIPSVIRGCSASKARTRPRLAAACWKS